MTDTPAPAETNASLLARRVRSCSLYDDDASQEDSPRPAKRRNSNSHDATFASVAALPSRRRNSGPWMMMPGGGLTPRPALVATEGSLVTKKETSLMLLLKAPLAPRPALMKAQMMDLVVPEGTAIPSNLFLPNAAALQASTTMPRRPSPTSVDMNLLEVQQVPLPLRSAARLKPRHSKHDGGALWEPVLRQKKAKDKKEKEEEQKKKKNKNKSAMNGKEEEEAATTTDADAAENKPWPSRHNTVTLQGKLKPSRSRSCHALCA